MPEAFDKLWKSAKQRGIMEIGGSIINLSGLIWTTDAGADKQERSVFMVQDHFTGNGEYDWDRDYFRVYYGEQSVEDALLPCFLAVLARSGKYTVEPLEQYIENTGEAGLTAKRFDVAKLPGRMNGLVFHKVAETQFLEARPFAHHRGGSFFRQDSTEDLWELREDTAETSFHR